VKPIRLLAAAALPLAAVLAAPSARAEDPVVRYPPSSVRPKLIAGGIAITGVAYGAAFLGSEATLTTPGSAELKYPVVGPWIALGLNACPLENPGCDAFVYLRAGLLVIDGLLQAGGLAVVIEGIAMKTEAVAAPAVKPLASFTLSPAPFVTPTAAGFGFVGTF
jgi:hypothetical protein